MGGPSAYSGPNGAGKSTLINTLLGFHNPHSGTARIFGHDIRKNARELRRLIGYMPESDSFVAEHDRRAVRAHDGRTQRAAAGARHSSARTKRSITLGWAKRDIATLGTYSLGMKQMAKLAQAIAHGPKLFCSWMSRPTDSIRPRGSG